MPHTTTIFRDLTQTDVERERKAYKKGFQRGALAVGIPWLLSITFLALCFCLFRS